MSWDRVAIVSFCLLMAEPGTIPVARSAESTAYIQANISTARIVETQNRFAVDISIMATDVETMFQKTGGERAGVDLSQPGALEREIGKFIASRVVMREQNGSECARTVERSGEDPSNDEGVLVALSFECSGENAFYDASKLLATQGPRAWQVVTVFRGEATRQVMINGDAPPLAMSATP